MSELVSFAHRQLTIHDDIKVYVEAQAHLRTWHLSRPMMPRWFAEMARTLDSQLGSGGAVGELP